jgi:5-methylcytosine-specific restriction enzyme A
MLPPRRCGRCHQLVAFGPCPSCRQAFEARRDSAAQRGYCSARWRKLRDYKLSLDPLCSVCLTQGKTTIATDVDHLRRHAGPHDPLFWDLSNVDSKCKSCHSRKTALLDSTFVSRER